MAKYLPKGRSYVPLLCINADQRVTTKVLKGFIKASERDWRVKRIIQGEPVLLEYGTFTWAQVAAHMEAVKEEKAAQKKKIKHPL